MSTYCPDPRSLSPADPPPAPPPVQVWHFLSEDLEHEHWTECPDEAEQLYTEYALRGDPYTATSYLEISH